ncbi:MAG: hypothetical protein IJH63_11340 [Methanobrevibacter sp.]|nr:hypothetical protein [Methanobrevibacter sp.]
MKKFLFFISILFIFLSVSSVGAGLFGPNTISCEQFSIEIPDGFEITDGWSSLDKHVDEIYLGTGVPINGEVHRYLNMNEVKSFDNLSIKNKYSGIDYIVVENYTENNLLVEKCQGNEKNFTYAEFNKDGYNYIIFINFDGEIEKLNLADDVSLIKGIISSTKHK